jgi:hypothetical protein
MDNNQELKEFFEILNGDFRNLPKRKSNVVKIFLSSTFSGIFIKRGLFLSLIKLCFSRFFFKDTYEERDYLIENIYPELRTYCFENYGLDFQVGIFLFYYFDYQKLILGFLSIRQYLKRYESVEN